MDTYAFDALMESKMAEVMKLYEEKTNARAAGAAGGKSKKMTSDPSELDFNSKKLIRQINAALDHKLKGSKVYKKKCAEELSNSTPQ
uniref:Uncharacterized protein n=1 Tax=viral metagenome TaxID=1070528 RepID=A0A6C0I9R3_9ZZZZ